MNNSFINFLTRVFFIFCQVFQSFMIQVLPPPQFEKWHKERIHKDHFQILSSIVAKSMLKQLQIFGKSSTKYAKNLAKIQFSFWKPFKKILPKNSNSGIWSIDILYKIDYLFCCVVTFDESFSEVNDLSAIEKMEIQTSFI